MATYDYDVVIVGSWFGGSVAALRAAEKGLSGRRHGGRPALERREHSKDPVGSAMREVAIEIGRGESYVVRGCLP
jgi:flavin-dependent dehydrogenase